MDERSRQKEMGRRVYEDYLAIAASEESPDLHELTEVAEMFEVPQLAWGVLIQLQGGKEEARQIVKNWIKAQQPFSGQITLRHLITMLVNYCQTDLESLLETIGFKAGNSANVEMLDFILQPNPDIKQADRYLDQLAELLLALGIDGQSAENLTNLMVPTFLPPLPSTYVTAPISEDVHDSTRMEYDADCEANWAACHALAMKLSVRIVKVN